MMKLKANIGLFKDSFIIDVDFTSDLKIGFHSDVMWNYFID